jgi:hypothetical protein
MLNFHIQLPKSWQEIAKQIEQEKDPEKLTQLSQELIAAIDSQVGYPSSKRKRVVKLDSKPLKSGTDD